MVAGVAQQAEGEQRRQGAEDAAVGDVIVGFEPQFGGIQQAEGGGETIHFTGGAHAENRPAIGLAALAQGTACGWRGKGCGGRDRLVRVTGDRLFFSRPCEMALWTVLGSTPSSLPMAALVKESLRPGDEFGSELVAFHRLRRPAEGGRAVIAELLSHALDGDEWHPEGAGHLGLGRGAVGDDLAGEQAERGGAIERVSEDGQVAVEIIDLSSRCSKAISLVMAVLVGGKMGSWIWGTRGAYQPQRRRQASPAHRFSTGLPQRLETAGVGQDV